MASKTILLDVKANDQQIKKLKLEILGTKDALSKYKKETKAGEHTQKELNEKIIRSTNSTKKYNAKLKDLTKEQRLNETITKSQAGSQKQIQALYSKGQIKLNGMSRAQRLTTKEGQRLTKSQLALNKQLKKNDATVGNHQRNVGNYTGSIKDALAQSGLFSRQLAGVAKGQALLGLATKGTAKSTTFFSKALKILKFSLISTGIGAIVVLLGSLIAYFKSSEEGTRDFKKALVPLKIIFANIKDIATKLGGALVNAFKNPKKTIDTLKGKFEQFKEFFKNTILKALKGYIDVWVGGVEVAVKGIILIYQKTTGIFKDNDIAIAKAQKNLDASKQKVIDGVIAIKDAAVNTAKGVAGAYTKMKNGVSDFIDENKKEIAIQQNIEDRRYALLQKTRDAKLYQAKLDKDIAKLRVIANDKEHQTAQARYDASKKWLDDIKKKEESKIEIIEENLKLQQLENSLATSGGEDLEKVTQLEIALEVAKTDAYQKTIRQVTKMGEAERELAKEKKRNIEISRLQIIFGEKVTAENYKQYQKREQDAIKHTQSLRDRLEKQNAGIEEKGLTKLKILEKQRVAELEGVEKGSIDEFLILEFYSAKKKELLDKEFAAEKELADKKEELEKKATFAKNQAAVMAGIQRAGEISSMKDFSKASLNLIRDEAKKYIAAKIAKAVASQMEKVMVTVPPPFSIIIAGLAGLAASTLFQKLVPKFSKGTILQGDSHANGGVQIFGQSGKYFGEGEGGEAIINKNSTRMFPEELSRINIAGGGRPLTNSSGFYAEGGSLAEREMMYQPVLVVQDVNDLNDIQTKIDVMQTF